jgi:hypothetical protein
MLLFMHRAQTTRSGSACSSASRLGLCLLGLGLGLFTPSRAAACGNAVSYVFSPDQMAKEVRKAEELLAQWRYYKVTETINYRPDKRVPRDPAPGSVEARRRRVLATALIRLGHAREARELIEPALARDPQSPPLRARLAEALVRLGGRANLARARKLLEELSTGDLMPDAEAYWLLAELRKGTGDAAGSQQALDRCATLAKGECPELEGSAPQPIAVREPPLRCVGHACQMGSLIDPLEEPLQGPPPKTPPP